MKFNKSSTISKKFLKSSSYLQSLYTDKSQSLSILVVFVIVTLFTGCATYEDMDQLSVSSLNTPDSQKEFIDEWLETNELMAYVLNDDNNIYIQEEAIKDIKTALKATINSGVWQYQNSQGQLIKRNQKPLNLKEYSNRVAMIKWSFARGYNCQEKPAGYMLPIHRAGDRNKKIIAAYETKEKGNWCIDNRSSNCKYVWKKITAKFIKVSKSGKLVKKRGKYLRSKEATLTIMVCVN